MRRRTQEQGRLVVGGGQAGLAMEHQLRRRGQEFVIVDEGSELGLSWRRRWGSRRLFTPACRDVIVWSDGR